MFQMYRLQSSKTSCISILTSLKLNLCSKYYSKNG